MKTSINILVLRLQLAVIRGQRILINSINAIPFPRLVMFAAIMFAALGGLTVALWESPLPLALTHAGFWLLTAVFAWASKPENVAAAEEKPAEESPAEVADHRLTMAEAFTGTPIQCSIYGRRNYNSQHREKFDFMVTCPQRMANGSNDASLAELLSSLFTGLESGNKLTHFGNPSRNGHGVIPFPPELVEHICIDLHGHPTGLQPLNLEFSNDDQH